MDAKFIIKTMDQPSTDTLSKIFDVIMTPQAVWGTWLIIQIIMGANLLLGHHYSDPEFYQYAGYFAQGKLPYINFPVEYPPLALILILLPAVPLLPFSQIAPHPYPSILAISTADPRVQAYGIVFGVMMSLVSALTLYAVMRCAKALNIRRRAAIESGYVYTLLTLATGAILQKFELVVGVLMLLAVVDLARKHEGRAWFWLAMATLIKGYPILLAPLFIVWMLLRGRFTVKTVAYSVLGGSVASLALTLPFIIRSGIHPFIHAIMYHVNRGVEIETIWSSVMMVIGWINQTVPISYYNPADLSDDIWSPAGAAIMSLATPLLLAAVIWGYIILTRRLKSMNELKIFELIKQQESAMVLIHVSLIIVLAFLLTFRALGSHYLVDALPLLAILRLPRKGTWLPLALMTIGFVLGQFVITIFPQLLALDPNAEALLLWRNIFLVSGFIFYIRAQVLPAPKEVRALAAENILTLKPQPEKAAASV